MVISLNESQALKMRILRSNGAQGLVRYSRSNARPVMDKEPSTLLELKPHIKTVMLSKRQVEGLKQICFKENLSLKKVIDIAINELLGIENIFYYSFKPRDEDIQRCERCKDFRAGDFSEGGFKFQVSCVRFRCPKANGNMRSNGFQATMNFVLVVLLATAAQSFLVL